MTERASECQTFVSLREYVDARFAASDKATEVAHRAMEGRLEAMNEFRSQLNQQASAFVTRSELLAVSGLIVAIATGCATAIGIVLQYTLR